MKKRKYTHASPREFVRVWQESSHLHEVARKVGSTKDACSRRASRYRDMGVPLKFMAEIPGEPTDWDELAEYARGLAPAEPKLGSVADVGVAKPAIASDS
jgi:hypothetical protein